MPFTALPRFSLCLALLVGLLMAGCATTPPAAPTLPVSSPTTNPPPAPIAVTEPAEPPIPVVRVDSKPASIVGSEETSTLFDNFTAYVAAVDGHDLAGAREGWSTPLPLNPGPHRLTVEFVRGVFTARAEMQFTAKSGGMYQLKFSTDAQLFGKNSHCEFWIVDSRTGTTVAPPLRTPLTRIQTPN